MVGETTARRLSGDHLRNALAGPGGTHCVRRRSVIKLQRRSTNLLERQQWNKELAAHCSPEKLGEVAKTGKFKWP